MTKIDELMRLADAYAHVYSFVRDNTMPLHREALRTALEAALKQKDEEIAELARLCDSTYVAQGADAYNHACEVLEHWQAKRAADGKEVGTTGSLCDGMAWLYERLDKLEAALKPEGPSFESATLPNGTKLYAPPPSTNNAPTATLVSNGRLVASAHSPIHQSGCDDARRLVACWNACDGLPTSDLENSALPEIMTNLMEAKVQRDALLEALKEIVDGHGVPDIPEPALIKARAAIAKAEGKA